MFSVLIVVFSVFKFERFVVNVFVVQPPSKLDFWRENGSLVTSIKFLLFSVFSFLLSVSVLTLFGFALIGIRVN